MKIIFITLFTLLFYGCKEFGNERSIERKVQWSDEVMRPDSLEKVMIKNYFDSIKNMYHLASFNLIDMTKNKDDKIRIHSIRLHFESIDSLKKVIVLYNDTLGVEHISLILSESKIEYLSGSKIR